MLPMRISETVLYITALVLCFSVSARADVRHVSVTGRAVITDEISLGQAKLAALNQARALAVEQAAGVSVRTVTLLQDSLLLGQLVETMAHGFLVEERHVTWTGSWQSSLPGHLGFPVIEVSLEVGVNVMPRTFFRDYAIEANLPKQTYRHGEAATLEVTAREDVYLLIANYTSKGKIVPVYPQRNGASNILRKGSHLSLPHEARDGWELIMQNYPGHEQDTEALIVLGLPADARTRSVSWQALFAPGSELEYAEFFSRVLTLPVEWLARKTLVYTVVRR